MAIEDVAAEVKEKKKHGGARPGAGRPKGAIKKARTPEPETDDRPPYVADPASIALSAILGNTLWGLSTMFTRCSPLTDEQRQQLGEAIDPVLYRWLPALDAWKAEATLVMVVWIIYDKNKPKPASDSEATEVSETNGTDSGEPRAESVGDATTLRVRELWGKDMAPGEDVS